MLPWVARFRRADAASAVSLRLDVGVEVAAAEGFVWVRGPELDELTEQRIRCLPVAEIYDVWPDGQLVTRGHRVPTLRLPDADWQPIREWFQIELPSTRWPGELPNQVPLRLVRSEAIAEANLLLVSCREWLEFAVHAPGVRLKPFTFATCSDGRVLVRGKPLPALLGTALVCTAGVAVAAGWRWEPAVDAAIVADVLGLAEDDVALLADDGSTLTTEVIRSDQFVCATRSAVRATAEALPNG